MRFKNILVAMILAAINIGCVYGQEADVPEVHKKIHQIMQSMQEESHFFMSVVDSTSNIGGEEPFELFPALDLYIDWDDDHVDPLRDKKNPAKIPDQMKIDISKFYAPTVGRVTSPFGWRRRRMHKGTDIKVITGDTVRAAFDGRVRIRKYDRRGYGYYYVVRHSNGLETVYGHLSKQIVEAGDYVRAGQALGLGGNTGRSTGSHLHFEMRFMGIALDPADLIDFQTFKPKSDIYEFEKSTAQWAQNNKGKSGRAGRQPRTGTGNRNQRGNANVDDAPVAQSKSKGSGVHVIRKGDTLGKVAKKYGTTVNRLCKLNGLKANSRLNIGQKIRYR